jgi:hypothetical protein
VSIGRITDEWGLERILKEGFFLSRREYYAGVGLKNIERAQGKSQNIQ